MEKEHKDIFFVEVHKPEEVKRGILESLKEIVESLQRFEKFKELRKNKIARVTHLGKIVKELNKIIPNLKNALPEAKIRAVGNEKHKAHGRRKAITAKKNDDAEAKKKPITELQKLESELNEIESKLSSLG